MAGATKGNADLATLAGLIGFGATQVQDQTFADFFDICQIKSDQLGGSKTTGPPAQQQGPIPEGAGIVPKRVQQDEQVFAQKRAGLILCGALHPFDPTHGGPHDFAAAGVRPGIRLMDLTQGRYSPRKAGRGQYLCLIGQIAGDQISGGRERAAPSREMGQIGAIGFARVFGQAFADEMLDGLICRQIGAFGTICGPG